MEKEINLQTLRDMDNTDRLLLELSVLNNMIISTIGHLKVEGKLPNSIDLAPLLKEAGSLKEIIDIHASVDITGAVQSTPIDKAAILQKYIPVDVLSSVKANIVGLQDGRLREYQIRERLVHTANRHVVHYMDLVAYVNMLCFIDTGKFLWKSVGEKDGHITQGVSIYGGVCLLDCPYGDTVLVGYPNGTFKECESATAY